MIKRTGPISQDLWPRLIRRRLERSLQLAMNDSGLVITEVHYRTGTDFDDDSGEITSAEVLPSELTRDQMARLSGDKRPAITPEQRQNYSSFDGRGLIEREIRRLTKNPALMVIQAGWTAHHPRSLRVVAE